ncbi:ABC transporter permease [Aminobacter sp. AP02]|uniref:FtsX-like permease family protein n=1 Tax=Aminobacter sp. AP02 TaxID=2135737 RepID=UPI000D7A5F45|nr:ABC transporter permease [Aminobacter sp. AP02]PWK72829.1 FtsX-like permease family protein [Aminobacter sp. AP02]
MTRAKGEPAALAQSVSATLADDPALQVKDVGSATHIIGSSLTAVDLSGLTSIELAFALGMAVAAAGLMLGLGFLDRRRSFAILTAIGAKPHQLAAFLWGEGLLVTVGGLVFGLLSGLTMAWMLVKLLTGVLTRRRTPWPSRQAISLWVLVLLLASIVAAVLMSRKFGQGNAAELLRDF